MTRDRRPRSGERRGLLLGYSTNVHPGENLGEIYRSLREYTIPIRKRVFGLSPAGLELRIGIGAARDLGDRGKREGFRDFLAKSGLRLFSVNAYPLLDFHARRVKEDAYRPPWTDPARARWTGAIAEILADILEPGRAGTVSTLGGTYRAFGHGSSVDGSIARGYLSVIEELFRIEERTGKLISLAVEPEPDTTFETARDLISFFEGPLLRTSRTRWKGRYGKKKGEEILRRYFTVNLDTCHFSVLFRQPALEMETIRSAGLAIGKIHVTSALEVLGPASSPRAYAEFRGLDEPRYLHQVRGIDGKGDLALAARDLDHLPPAPPDLAALRSHFHVPVHRASWGRLGTTREETREALELALRRSLCDQLVIETYTWPVIAGAASRGSRDRLIDGIVGEFRWLLGICGPPD